MKKYFISGLIALSALASTAAGNLVGGVFRTDDAWNTDANTAIGVGDAQVIRMYVLFDDPSDTLISIFNANIQSMVGGSLYQNAMGADLPPDAAMFGGTPALEWDSYVSIGNLVAPSTTNTDPNFNFTATGVSGNSGWYTGDPPMLEGRGSLNGDSGLYETLVGQWTILGAASKEDGVIRPGRFSSDVFRGGLDLVYQGDIGSPPQVARNLRFVPAPGGSVVILCGAAALARRRR